jgi:hypothetical protein
VSESHLGVQKELSNCREQAGQIPWLICNSGDIPMSSSIVFHSPLVVWIRLHHAHTGRAARKASESRDATRSAVMSWERSS